MARGKKPKIHTFTDYELKRYEDKIFHRALVVFLSAAYEEFQWQNDDSVVRLANRVNRYDMAQREHLITIRQMEKLLSGETGIRFNAKLTDEVENDNKD